MKKEKFRWQETREIVIERLLKCRTEGEFNKELYILLKTITEEINGS